MNEVLAVLIGVAGAVVFVEAFIRFNAFSRIGILIAQARQSMRVVASSAVSDHWKEKVLPRYAGRILRHAFVFLLFLAVALALLLAVTFALGWALNLPGIENGEILYGWPFNLGALGGGCLYAFIRKWR
ncbi:MAG: hypothetical protein RIM72_06465 [Alphaproteobacteria bacterium]